MTRPPDAAWEQAMRDKARPDSRSPAKRVFEPDDDPYFDRPHRESRFVLDRSRRRQQDERCEARGTPLRS
jgi:hypothetical protein